MRGSYDDYLTALGQRESGGNYGLESSLGFLGKYQMSEASLGEMGYYLGDATPGTHDYAGRWSGKDGIWSKWDFLQNPAVQEKAARAYHVWNVETLAQYDLAQYAGQTLNGQRITASGLLGSTWLVGFEGMRQFLQSGGTHAANDPYGTSMLEYIALFNDFDTPFPSALGGDDLIRGGPGQDVLTGGAGDDTLDGAAGHDGAFFRGTEADWDFSRDGDAIVARGPDGTDRLLNIEFVRFGDGSTVAVADLGDGRPVDPPTPDTPRPDGPRPHTIAATAGDDRARGGGGDERIDGRGGDDRLLGAGGDDVLRGRTGDDSLDGGRGHDRLAGDAGADRIGGGNGNDRAGGGTGADLLDGGAGHDTLAGGDGADVLRGRAGDDSLAGGRGDDVLAGGSGDDVFVFDRGDGRDTVTDFAPGADRLDLRAFAAAFGDLHIAERGGDAVVSLGHLAVRLDYVAEHRLSAADFIL